MRVTLTVRDKDGGVLVMFSGPSPLLLRVPSAGNIADGESIGPRESPGDGLVIEVTAE